MLCSQSHMCYMACYWSYSLSFRYCEASVDIPPSCTNPDTQFSIGDLCPSPPKLSLNDYLTDTTGRLDSDNTYVNEYLLRIAERMGASTYSSRVQGGFTLSYTGIILTGLAVHNRYTDTNTLISDYMYVCVHINFQTYWMQT